MRTSRMGKINRVRLISLEGGVTLKSACKMIEDAGGEEPLDRGSPMPPQDSRQRLSAERQGLGSQSASNLPSKFVRISETSAIRTL